MRQKMPTALRGRSGVSGRRLLLGGLLLQVFLRRGRHGVAVCQGFRHGLLCWLNNKFKFADGKANLM